LEDKSIDLQPQQGFVVPRGSCTGPEHRSGLSS
jgi:hypothetical protein